MKKRIFSRFNEVGKWKDIINLNTFEVVVSIIISILMLLVLFLLNLHENLNVFIDAFKNISIYIFQALIGMLGIILAGLAFLISVLKRDSIKSIKKYNGNASIQQLLISFEYLAFIIGIGIFLFLGIHIALYNDEMILNNWQLYIVLGIVVYFLSFIIFYTVSLIGNCIRVFYINDLYTEILEEEKNVYELANDIKIDYLFYYLQKKANLSPEELIGDLERLVDDSNIQDKQSVKAYLRNYYGLNS